MLDKLKQLPLREEDTVFLQAIEQQAQQKEMKLGVFGSFSVGKSALINALVGRQDLLPTHTNETTAVPTYILGGDEDRIEVHKFNGEIAKINVLQLHALKAGGEINEVEKVVIYQTAPSWLKEITFIDTPGRNTKFQAHIEASETALVTSDAVLYVMPWQGLTLEDIVYIKHILRYQPNLYFVINKVDRIDESQGITIEQLQKRVAEDLNEQLGKAYPVFAVSATTGFNIDQLYTQFLLPLKAEIKQIKESRFNHALQQFLLREMERVAQRIQLYEQAATADVTNLEQQKQAIQLQFEQANIDVASNVEVLRDTLHKAEEELQRYVQTSYEQLELNLKNLAKLNLSVDELTLKIENEIVSTRNEVFAVLRGRIQKIVGEEATIQLQQLDNTTVKLNITQPNLEYLHQQYETERTKVFTKIAAAQQQLEQLPVEGTSSQQRDMLIKEIEILTQHAMEQFVPQYVADETFDENKATKIASAIGFAGDMVLTVGLAVATAGTSAAAQVGGKVAAKEAAKKAAKEAAKKIALETAEKALINGVQIAVSTTSSPDGNGSKVLKAAKALDQFTSPIQTIAKKIGSNIDSTRTQPKQEDLQHRREFFARKFEMESERDERVHQLKELEEKASTNERIRQEVMQKRVQVEKTSENKIQQLEADYEKEVQRAQEAHINAEIEVQIQQVLQEEEQQLNLWFKTEFGMLLNSVEQMLPKQLQQELQQWEQQIQHIEQLKSDDSSKIQQELDAYKQHLQTIESMLTGEQNAISV